MAGYDLTFNGSGRVVADLGGIDRVSELGIAANGKLLALSYAIDPGVATINPAIITRYNPDGSLDTSFATAGKLNTGLAGYALTSPDGKIIVYGKESDGKFAIIRYNPDGSLDTSFATAGKYLVANPLASSNLYGLIQLRTNPTNSSSEIIFSQTFGEPLTLDTASGQSIVNPNRISTTTLLDVNGQIKSLPINGIALASPLSIKLGVLRGIVASQTTNSADPDVQQLVNLLGEELLDRLRAKFSTNGFRIYDVVAGAQSDGSILLSFQGYPSAFFANPATSPSPANLSVTSRITSTGTFDSNFGVDGLLTSPFFVDGTTVTIGDGKFDITSRAYFAVYNSGTQDISVYRYTNDGRVDTMFGSNGKFTLPSDLLPQVPNPLTPFPSVSVVIDSQNRALVSIKNFDDSFISVVRVNSNGTIDNTFGSNGKIQLQSKAGDLISPAAVVLNVDNRLSFGGAINDDILIAKYDISGVSSTILTSPILNRTDFNGDGKSDILWRNNDGSLALWQMNGLTATSSSIGALPADWTTAGTGDFSGDGKADLLLRNTDGRVATWQMNGSTVNKTTTIGTLTAGWSIAGTGDLNGDGTADVILTNTNGAIAEWQMNNGTATAKSIGTLTNGWSIAGSADFNGDGKADILFKNTDGRIAEWQMNGSTVLSAQVIGAITPDWSISATGDFNGDGKADILFRNTNGSIAEWQMNGATVTSTSIIGSAADWNIAGTGDYNGDGKADILWRNTISGNVAEWQMNGSTVLAAGLTSLPTAASSWNIAA